MARKRRSTSKIVSDPQWYKDAVIYELHIKAFQDSNDDGIGDIRGIISRLDYLQNLGVTALWLLPFYPSPLRDDGYDIAYYTDVNPSYGTLSDFRELLKQAHVRGLRVITELVLNHTSDQHPWFRKSRQAKPGSKWRDYYVWSDTPDRYADARIIFQDFEQSNWTWDPVAKAYYWHRFYSHQPDLNFENPKVHKALIDVIDFWFDMGVDGLRLDAVPYLYEREETNCENLPETHEFLKKLRAHVDRKYKDRMLLAEANQWSEDAIAYFGDGDECHMAFNFPVMPRMFMALQMEERYPIIEILDPPLEIPENAQWAMFLRNHDELTLEMVTDEERDYMYRMYAEDPRAKINVGIRRRLAPLLGNNRKRIELLNILLLSLPGTPVLYYGDEIGMGDNYYLGDRDGVRTPMQWTPDRNAGFSKANPHKLYLPTIIEPEYHFEAINVETQDRNSSSLLWWMRRVIAMRRKFKAFSRGTCEFLAPQNHRVLAFIRQYEDETILVVVNLSRFSQAVELDLSNYTDMVPREVFSHNDFPRIKDDPYQITLGPHNHYWFQLCKAPDEIDITQRSPVKLKLAAVPEDRLEPEIVDRLENRILPHYMRSARWFGSKGRKVRKVTVRESIVVPAEDFPVYLLLAQVEYNEGTPEFYQIPVAFVTREAAHEFRQDFPNAILAEFTADGEEGVLVDAVYADSFQAQLFDMIARRRRIKGQHGSLISSRGKTLKRELDAIEQPLETRLLKAEQSNSSILYGDKYILKLYRKLEDGMNPDVEVGRTLSEKRHFEHIPDYKGGIAYQRPRKNPYEIGLLQEFVRNEGDAWTYMLGHISQYFETLLARRRDLTEAPEVFPLDMSLKNDADYSPVHNFVGDFHTEKMVLLGQRTAEMHIALAKTSTDKAFAPEGFSQLYQRSVYQSMRNLARSVFRTLEKNYNKLDRAGQEEADQILASQNSILARLRKITGKKISAMKIRIHGDYHLGQVLFTGKDFVIIDFEGEPARPLSERRLKRSPLRDVAGMVRSFHYAVYTGLRQNPSVRPDDMPFVMPWVRGWYHYAATNFLRGYLQAVDNVTFLPKKTEEANILFEAFLLEKAVYELGYELNNRPDWVTIPMKGINYILEQADNM